LTFYATVCPPPAFFKQEYLLEVLTTQELKILKLASTEISNKEIANFLGISDQTVKKHRQNIYAKLDIHGKTDIRRLLRITEKYFQ
jgi:DNA-binding CsgD family transcriptional regulator